MSPGENPFVTIAGPGRAAVEIRGSRFIGLARPVRTIDEAEAFDASVRNEHPDATHVVPAWRVRADPLRGWSDDDGEPTGSAGKPALTVLERRDLENVVVCVVRYYGGTNLGVGGLARAYARATKAAIDDAVKVEHHPEERLEVRVEYNDSGTVRGILESEAVDFEADYGSSVRYDAWIPVADIHGLRDRILSATSGRATVESTGDG